MQIDPLTTAILCSAALSVLAISAGSRLLPAMQRSRRRRGTQESLDTVVAWMPEPARVMNMHEIEALELARRAAPGSLLLSQVPLSRFLRVPTRHSYHRWLARVGHFNADLLVCDAHSQVLAVVDVRDPAASERSRRRHERMTRVLRAAGITVLVWHQDRLPTITAARAQFAALGVPAMAGGATEQAAATGKESAPIPLEPRALREVLAEGDAAAARRPSLEPVNSDFHDYHATPATVH